MPVFLVILFILYFIHDQFEFSSINRISYWIIPIYTLYQFFNTFKMNLINLLLVIGILIFSIAVSYYQAIHTRIRIEETSSTFFKDDKGNEIPIYRKVVTAQGGRQYLYGWIVILIVQIIIEVTYLHESLTVNRVWDIFFEEVLADVLSFRRFSTSLHTSWILWALMAFSSLGYTLWIAKLSPSARRKLFKKDKFVNITNEGSHRENKKIQSSK